MTDFSLLLPNIFDDNTRADKERMKRMILRLQNLQSFYYYHSEKSFVSVSFHPLSIHPCFVTKQRWAQFCVKDVKGEKSLENLWPKCPPTKPPTSHFVHVEIQRYHLLEGFETRTWPEGENSLFMNCILLKQVVLTVRWTFDIFATILPSLEPFHVWPSVQ